LLLPETRRYAEQLAVPESLFPDPAELAEELTNELLVLLGLLVIFLPLFFEIFVYGAPYRSLVNLALF
jgi:hypothetical protein